MSAPGSVAAPLSVAALTASVPQKATANRSVNALVCRGIQGTGLDRLQRANLYSLNILTESINLSLRQQNKLKARAGIIRAAQTLIAEHGLESTTTRAIADAAGVSYQTVYNYFPTKALILRALLDEEFADWSKQTEQIIKRYDGDLIESFLNMTQIGIDKIQGPKRDLWAAMAASFFREPNPDSEHVAQLSMLAHEHCYGLLHMAQGMGHLSEEVDLHLLAHTLFSLADYSILMMFFMPVPTEQFLTTQRQQLELILTPYLIQSPATPVPRSD